MARILIADDVLPVRMILRRILLSAGHEVLEAANGDEALDLLLNLRPDVVILDIRMPGQSGLDVCRAARIDPRTAATGIILLSGNVASDQVSAAGADSAISKPFSVRQVLSTVTQLLARGARATPAGQPAVATGASGVPGPGVD